ncbi:hypothetical protein OH492_12555 [Vibrio chagasii]|nr:hypothetical protein [Vibrio chagasii]
MIRGDNASRTRSHLLKPSTKSSVESLASDGLITRTESQSSHCLQDRLGMMWWQVLGTPNRLLSDHPPVAMPSTSGIYLDAQVKGIAAPP